MTADAHDLKTLGINLAHEIRTPLAAIKAGVSGIKDFLPILIDAYNKAATAEILDSKLQPRHLDLLSKILDNMETSTGEANTCITNFVKCLKSSYE